MNLGQKIRNRRLQEGLSAQKLANKLGLKKENIYKWEGGSKPQDPEEFRIVENWLNNVEAVPNGSKEDQTPSGVESRYVQLMEERISEFKERLQELKKVIEHHQHLYDLVSASLQHFQSDQIVIRELIVALLEQGFLRLTNGNPEKAKQKMYLLRQEILQKIGTSLQPDTFVHDGTSDRHDSSSGKLGLGNKSNLKTKNKNG